MDNVSDVLTDVNYLFCKYLFMWKDVYKYLFMWKEYILLSENENDSTYDPIIGGKKKNYLPAHPPIVTYIERNED